MEQVPFSEFTGPRRVRLYDVLGAHFRSLGTAAGLREYELDNIEFYRRYPSEQCSDTLALIQQKRGKAFTVGVFLELVERLNLGDERFVEINELVMQ